MPEVGDTVLGVRRTDGGYQTVRAGALAPGGLTAGATPAPVVAAYTALEAVKTSAASKTGSPYMGNAVRLAYDCPTTTRLATKFWPDGLPAPAHSRGTGCPETLTVSGSGADIARQACLDYDSALKSDAATQEVPYLAEGEQGHSDLRVALGAAGRAAPLTRQRYPSNYAAKNSLIARPKASISSSYSA